MENNTTFPMLDLDRNMISAANAASQFNAGDHIAQDAQRAYAAGLAHLQPQDEWTAEQTAYAERRATEWRDLVTKAYNDILRRRASWMPWTVCGPARYNQKKNSTKADAQMHAEQEWNAKLNLFIENTDSALAALRPADVQIAAYRSGKESAPVSADDPLALEKLTARRDYLREEHDRGIQLNKHFRKHNTMRSFPGISDAQTDVIDAQISAQPSYLRMPWPSSPANELATIKRIEARIEEIQRRSNSTHTNAAETFENFRIEHDTAANRIRIYFDDKPDSDTRTLLKSNGFKWAPSASAWQRMLNANGIAAAKRIAEALAVDAAEPVEPDTLTLEEFAERIRNK